MLRMIPMTALALLAGCAAAATSQFSTAGVGPISQVVECAAEEVREDGFTVVHADDAGILHAERGAETVEVRVIPGDLNRYVLEVNTSDTELARSTGADVVETCGS